MDMFDRAGSGSVLGHTQWILHSSPQVHKYIEDYKADE